MDYEYLFEILDKNPAEVMGALAPEMKAQGMPVMNVDDVRKYLFVKLSEAKGGQISPTAPVTAQPKQGGSTSGPAMPPMGRNIGTLLQNFYQRGTNPRATSYGH